MKRLIPICIMIICFSCSKVEPLDEMSYSENIWVDGQIISAVYVPTSFTPDGDGLNDFFGPKMTGIKECSFSIYNKNQLIFQSHELNPSWDGTLGGFSQQNGTYEWQLVAVDTVNNEYDMEGMVNLLR